jgi:hypothetical protein
VGFPGIPNPETAPDLHVYGAATTASTTLGLTLAVGDISGDGGPELMVAAPAETSNYGRVYMFGR